MLLPLLISDSREDGCSVWTWRKFREPPATRMVKQSAFMTSKSGCINLKRAQLMSGVRFSLNFPISTSTMIHPRIIEIP